MGTPMRYQPQGLLRINPNHPLAAGLVGFWLPSGGQFISAVPGIPAASLTSAATIPSGPKGRLLKGDGSKVVGTIANDPRYLPTSAITVLVDGISANAGNQYWFTSEVSSNGFGMYAGGAHSYMRIGGGWADVGTGILAGEVCQGGMTYDGSTFWSIKNGKRANSVGASGVIVQASSGITLGGTTSGGAGGGASYYFAIWNRALSPAELASFYANPWQIFDAGSSSSSYQSAIIVSAAATGGGTTDTGTLTWTEDNDVSSLVSLVTNRASITWVESNDIHSLVTLITDRAVISYQEDNDIHAISASMSGGPSYLAWTEDSDICSIQGNVSDLGALLWTEANDTHAMSGQVYNNVTMSWTESDDTSLITGVVTNFGTMSWTEQNDGVLFLPSNSANGSIRRRKGIHK